MTHVNKDKINNILSLINDLVDLRRKCKKSKSKKLHKELTFLQQAVAKELDFLVEARAKRYKNFSNYDDLCQDGRLALFLALQSYEPEKGDFFWWANKYIKTKISREANRHSTIKIPLKHAKLVQPYKVSQLPTIIDNALDPSEKLNQTQVQEIVKNAVSKLPQDQQQIVNLHFELQSSKDDPSSIGKICESLGISRANCMKILNEAKKNLKVELNI
jgi:RNA polymerase sigma factor (sigma-70 family)